MHLVEGESVERILRPHPLSVPGLYAFPALFLLLSAGFWLLFASEAWLLFLGRDVERPFLPYVVATAVVALTVMAASYVGMHQTKRLRTFLSGVLAAALVSLGSPLLGLGYAEALPILLLLAAAGAIAVAEVSRRRERCVVTNYRLVFERGFLVPEERSVRFNRVSGIEAKRSVLSRFLDTGTLVVHLDPAREVDPEPLLLRGVRPVARTRDQLLSLVRKGAEAAYLGDKSEAVARVEELLGGGRKR